MTELNDKIAAMLRVPEVKKALSDFFVGSQTEQERAAQQAAERAYMQQYGEEKWRGVPYREPDYTIRGLESAYGPGDMIAGGVAGVMTAPAASLGRFLFEAATDPAYEVAINYLARDNGYLPAMYIGKKGMRRLGIDAGTDLAGQFSALHDRKPRLEIDDSGRRYTTTESRSAALGDIFQNDRLFASDESLKDVALDFGIYPTAADSGKFEKGGNFFGGDGTITVNGSTFSNADQINLHELQHAIQEREGFARGGSPEQFTQQKEAELVRDAKNWRKNVLANKYEPKAHKRTGSTYEDKEHNFIQYLGEEDALDWMMPSEEARAYARTKYATMDDPDTAELIKLYGLDKRVTPYKPMELYQRLAGEIESRDTAARMNLSPAERARTQPYSSYAVRPDGTFGPTYEKNPISLDDFIVRYGDNGPQMSLPHDIRKNGGRYPHYQAFDGDVVYGDVWLPSDSTDYVADVRVGEKYRGNGIANSLYDFIEADIGHKLNPSDNLSYEGFKLWSKRNPELVKDSLYHHRDNLIGKKAEDNIGNVGEIVEVRNDKALIKKGNITTPVPRKLLEEQGLL